MAERSSLLNCRTCMRTQGSNPCISATIQNPMSSYYPDNEPSPWQKLQAYLTGLYQHAKSEKDPNIYAAIAYIPLFGWLIAYFFRPKQKLCMFHAYQSFKLNLIALGLFFILWFITNFPLISWFLKLILFQPIVTDFLYYTVWLALFGLSTYAAYKAYEMEEYYLPFMKELDDFIHDKVGNS